MTKAAFSAAALFLLAALAFPGAAQAQCWWTGLGSSCAAAPAPPYRHYAPYSRYPPYPAPYAPPNRPPYYGAPY